MLIKGLLNFDLELLKCWPKVFSISIWSCWNVDQRSSLLRSEIAQSQSWWKATKGLLNLGTWRKAIKGLLYFNLDLLKCPPNVISTSIWTCWNVEQMSSLLRSGLVEMSIKGLLWYGLVEMSIKGLLYFDLKLLNLNLDERQPKGFLMLELQER